LGHHDAADTPEDAMLTTMPIYPGDVLVLGSDGLFDNLADEDVVAKVEAGMLQGQSPSAIAQALTFAAFDASMNKYSTTPYSLAASAAFEMVYTGGKVDDITCLVAVLD
jgi:protein phosphatase PTC7